MNTLRIALAFSLLVLLTGCASNTVWHKPGATQDDLSRTRYACTQQSQQGAGVASYFADNSGSSHSRSYGGSAHVFVFTNPQLFDACMNAAGWNAQAKPPEPSLTQLQPPSPQGRPPQQLNPDQPGNASSSTSGKVSAPEQASLETAAAAYDKLRNDETSLLRQSRSPKDKIFIQYLDQVATPAAIKNRLDFYNGTVTGEAYLRRKTEINDALYAEKKKIYRAR